MLPIKLNIPDSFYVEEEKCNYHISSEMKKVWAVELDLLNEFSECCKKHQLKWFVHAGTMLGAVRHKGFIPWDDDIDVVMPREDYEKFCKIAPDEFSHPYFFQNEDTDRFFARSFSRLRNSETTAILESEKAFCFPFNQGIFIDIFPLDSIPNEDNELRSQIDKLTALSDIWQWRNLVYFYQTKKGKGYAKMFKYYIKHLLYKYIKREEGDYKNKLKEYYNVVTQYNSMGTSRVAEMIIPPLNRHIWNKNWVENVILMPFEMIEVSVPEYFNECLTASFGKNWQTPIKQHTMHWGVIFDAEKPYTEYLKKK